MFTCVGYATSAADRPLQPFTFERRDPGPNDVRIDIQYCGVCHSDLKRRNFAGSLIGGIAETQEMLDFCGQHGLTADIEMIRMEETEGAYARMLKSDVKYRFVIDMETMPAAA